MVASDDGEGYLSVSDTFTMDITTTNLPPTASDNTLSIQEDTSVILSVSDFGFLDSDQGDTLHHLKITALESAGVLTLVGVDVVLDQEVTLRAIENGELSFVPDSNDFASDYASFQFQVHDGTEYSTQSQTISFDVTSVQDKPTGSNITVTTNEDTSLAFSLADFDFQDSDPGETLNQIKITTLEKVGSLILNGEDVTLDQVISVDDIVAGKLRFNPGVDGHGNGYDLFGFKVGDGLDFSAEAYSMTIDVTAINDAPNANDDLLSINQNEVGSGSLIGSDVDGDVLTFSKVDDATLGVVTVDVDGSFTYTPNQDAVGEDTFTFQAMALIIVWAKSVR